MPKRVFKLPSFSKGVVSNASPRDIPDDALAYAENVDSRVAGKVRGIPENETVNASFDARVMTPLTGDEAILIGQDSARQFKKYDIATDTVTNIDSATTEYAFSMVPSGEAAYVGMSDSFRGGNPMSPKWIGKINNPPFNIISSGSYAVQDAEAKSFASIQEFDNSVSPLITLGNMPGTSDAALMGGSSGAFKAGKRYFWAVSLIYDGFQESPLIKGYTGNTPWHQDAIADKGYADLNLRLGWNTGDFPYRVTGINIYRAEGPEGASEPLDSYFLVESISDLSVGGDIIYRDMGITLSEDVDTTETAIDVSDGSIVSDGDNIQIGSEVRSVSSVSGNTLTISSPFSSAHSFGETVKIGFGYWAIGSSEGYPSGHTYNKQYFFRFRDSGGAGASYENNTGSSDTLEDKTVNYKLSTAYSGYLFVGDCSKAGIADAGKYIFRSQPKNYSNFDWSTNFAILPEKPTALIGFNGRLYAFSEANMYRVNPFSMAVEDDYPGVGSLNENTVLASNYGMFHADDDNIYINDGRTSIPIGTPIQTVQFGGNAYGWKEITKTGNGYYASLAFDADHSRLLAFGNVDASTNICWAYDVERERWDLYTSVEMPSAVVSGADGTLYGTVDDGASSLYLKSLFTSATRKNWKIVTKDFDLGSDSGDFWAYDLQGYGEGYFTIKYLKDGSGTATDNGTSTVNGLRKSTVASIDKKMKSIALQVESAAATDELDNLTVQFRPQVIRE